MWQLIAAHKGIQRIGDVRRVVKNYAVDSAGHVTLLTCPAVLATVSGGTVWVSGFRKVLRDIRLSPKP